MNYPSIKTLAAITDTPEQAKKLRAVLTLKKREEVCAMSEQATAYQNQCYNPPEFYLLKLYAANEIMGGYGIKAIDIPEGSFSNCQTPDICIDYVNMGDTYTVTLCRINNRGHVTYRVTDWGSIVERYSGDGL
jgi:hypothetical protein